MYDEDQLYNETTQAIKNGAHNVKAIASDAKTIYDMLRGLNSSSPQKVNITSESLPTKDSDFVFTGQSTDLRFFKDHNKMSIEMINSIPDETLKSAVMDEMNKAANAERVKIDLAENTITITQKGKSYINKPTFIKAAAVDLANFKADQAQIMGFELDGTIQDMNYFQFAPELDLKPIIANPDTATVQKILGNLQQLKEQGLISVSNSIVKITDKGKELIGSAVFKAANAGAIEKAAAVSGGTAGKIFAVTKKIASAVASTAIQK